MPNKKILEISLGSFYFSEFLNIIILHFKGVFRANSNLT
jgi:hypothetical protein